MLTSLVKKLNIMCDAVPVPNLSPSLSLFPLGAVHPEWLQIKVRASIFFYYACAGYCDA